MYCDDCGIFTYPDNFYLLKHQLWHGIAPDPAGYLCIPCGEKRLGRKFAAADYLFTPAQMRSRYAAHLIEAGLHSHEQYE